jgi:hypothetical protein
MVVILLFALDGGSVWLRPMVGFEGRPAPSMLRLCQSSQENQRAWPPQSGLIVAKRVCQVSLVMWPRRCFSPPGAAPPGLEAHGSLQSSDVPADTRRAHRLRKRPVRRVGRSSLCGFAGRTSARSSGRRQSLDARGPPSIAPPIRFRWTTRSRRFPYSPWLASTCGARPRFLCVGHLATTSWRLA